MLLSLPAKALDPEKAFHQYVIDRWSIEEGLPQITVPSIVQGPEGYIWSATQSGLARFDGVEFTNFDPRNTPELPGALVQELFVDSQERLWVGTYRGPAFYSGRQFHAIAGPGESEASVNVHGFAETEGGDILVATESGLYRVVDDKLVAVPGLPAGPFQSVFIDEQGVLWIGGRGVIIEQAGEEWRRHQLGDDSRSARVNEIGEHDGQLFAATDAGLLQKTADGWQLTGLNEELDSVVIETLYSDRDDNLWVSTAYSLIRIHGGRVTERVDDDDGYAHEGVLGLTEDHEGNLWLGSRWYGIARLWNGWVFRYGAVEGLHNELVWSLARDEEGALWVGTMEGLSRFDEGRFEKILAGEEQPHPHAYTLFVDTSHVWVGTRSGLVWWDRKRKQLDTPEEFDQLGGAQINGIIQRDDGTHWIATSEGVWEWNGETLSPRFEGMSVRILLETRGGTLFAGSHQGLFRLNDEDEFELIPEIPEDADITALSQLSDGRLVAGSLGEDLFMQLDGEWQRFGAEDGLPPNSPFAVEEHDEMLWVAGIRGIYQIPLSGFQDYMDGEIDVLPGRMILHERGDISGAQKGYCCNGAGNAKGFMEGGELWLPSRGGIVHVIPERIEFNKEAPQVVVERVRLKGDWQQLRPGESIDLPADERDIAFGFTALSFQDPGSVQLEYRLRGYDDEWRRVDDIRRRTAFFTNLPSGDFEFQVRGSNNAGVWSESPAELSVSIKRHFHETLWFRSLAVLLAIILIWAGYRVQLRSLRAQRQRLEQTVAERTEELRIANENLVKYSQQLEEASNTDPLTGLWNRRYLVDQLPKDLSHFHRQVKRAGHEGEVMVFALVDLDHFKRINDTHGHGVGDVMLQQFANILLQQVREGDYVVRWGGEEFLIIFRPMPSDQPPLVAERLRLAVESAEFVVRESESIHLTCSIGFSEYPAFHENPDAVDWEEIVELADQALYYAKAHGRNGWCIFRPSEAIEPGTLREELEKGMDELISSGHMRIITSGDKRP